MTPRSPTTETADFIETSDPRWEAVLERVPHDIYQRPEYVAVAASHEGGRPAAFYAREGEDEFLVPLVIRALPRELDPPDGATDVITPYGYSAPVTTAPGDAHRVAAFAAAFAAVGREQGVVSAFLRLHPLLELNRDALGAHGRVRPHGETVYVELNRPDEEIWRDMRSNHRRGIRSLESDGFTASVDDWSREEDFARLYRETMLRVDADDYYFFGPEHFRELREALAGRLHLCVVSGPEGRPAAAGLFFETDGIVQYHLGGTADEFRRSGASKLMFHAVMRWGAGAGHRVLHLGGGLGGREDSLFHFKAGFSPARASFHTVSMVFDPAAYDQLVARAHPETGDGATDFFPRYRAPAADTGAADGADGSDDG
ncbi:MAG: GNAT family N-acetyltransferase [Gemmatimonadetes bacterium]|nr:GNAT family N-acetyltransferase [Gemmatimonadota bacterium]NIQ52193.1 GNAT family N-acetyltransferase [Gemmatimonadota bacterium]NIU77299.1 GNAT family N-acetyltransferase [Gammaproteobacteria bacterium]NIX42794.1 GNAT family N-acetyltransferase [Gemmatimonadota bacterium]NIY06959.1 GNAT family N-acetyltransferase [Gemmatimonadota bacterium]